jgi:hypothetical protein
MAFKKEKYIKPGFQIGNVLAAAGGGAGVHLGLNFLEEKVDFIAENPVVGPAIMEVVGIAASYFGTPEGPIAAGGHGMIGAATAELFALKKAEKSAGGFSRVNVNHERFLNQSERESLRDRFRDDDDDDSDSDDGM